MIKFIKPLQYLLSTVLVLSLLAGCKTSKAQMEDTSTSIVKELKDEKLANALLWKISGNKLTKPSFLYGTIHIIDKDDFFLPEGTLGAIEDSEKMVFEINMEDMSDMSNAMSLMQKAFMKDNLTLKDLLSEEEYTMVGDHFKKLGFPLMFFERIKPMFLTVFASGDMDPMAMQSGKIKSYEMEFMEMAKDSKMPMGGLETIDFQMSVFDSIPYKAQAEMLVESIQSGDTGTDQFKQMVDIYKAQDLNAMQEMFAAEQGGLEGYDDILIVGRNKNWIPQMVDMMAVQPTFFAVGAGHLGGEFGVINLLKDKGYTLTPFVSKKI